MGCSDNAAAHFFIHADLGTLHSRRSQYLVIPYKTCSMWEFCAFFYSHFT